MSISGLRQAQKEKDPDEFDFTVEALNLAIERHLIYFREFYHSTTLKTQHVRRNLQKQGVVFTGQRYRISKRFFHTVSNYMEASTVVSNGKRAYVILTTRINEKQEVQPDVILFFDAFTNKERIYVYYNNNPWPGQEKRLIGIRGHAIARYKERKADVSPHEVVKEIYRIIRTEAFQTACIPYRQKSLENKSKENMVYRSGDDELRVTVSVIYKTFDGVSVDRGLIVIVHTYINLGVDN